MRLITFPLAQLHVVVRRCPSVRTKRGTRQRLAGHVVCRDRTPRRSGDCGRRVPWHLSTRHLPNSLWKGSRSGCNVRGRHWFRCPLLSPPSGSRCGLRPHGLRSRLYPTPSRGSISARLSAPGVRRNRLPRPAPWRHPRIPGGYPPPLPAVSRIRRAGLSAHPVVGLPPSIVAEGTFHRIGAVLCHVPLLPTSEASASPICFPPAVRCRMPELQTGEALQGPLLQQADARRRPPHPKPLLPCCGQCSHGGEAHPQSPHAVGTAPDLSGGNGVRGTLANLAQGPGDFFHLGRLVQTREPELRGLDRPCDLTCIYIYVYT